jgi:ABC-2 type transport system permease protein
MSVAFAYLEGAIGMVKRDARLFLSYRFRFASQILSAFFSVTLFYYISRLVRVGSFDTSDAYFAFAVVGLVILEVLVSTISGLPARVRQELVAGTFERVILSPFGAVAGVASMTVFPFLLALVSGAITIAFAVVVFGMQLRWATAPLSIPVAFLGGLAFLPFALLIAGAVIVVKQAESGVGYVVTFISLIGGFFFPVALLPDWLQWLSRVQPFTPTLQLLRNLLVGTPLHGSPSVFLLKIVLWAVVLLPPTAWALARAVRVGQQRGTIIEY